MAFRPPDTDPDRDYGMLPGWAPLVRQLVSDLNEVWGEGNWRIAQVKEKFGTLRFYWYGDERSGDDDYDAKYARATELVDAAERRSAQLCEVCGATAWGPQASSSGWLYTLCPAHRVENRKTGDPAWQMADARA